MLSNVYHQSLKQYIESGQGARLSGGFRMMKNQNHREILKSRSESKSQSRKSEDFNFESGNSKIESEDLPDFDQIVNNRKNSSIS